MKNKKTYVLYLFLFISAGISLVGCSDNPSSLGKDLIKERGVGVVDTSFSQDQAYVKSSFYKPDTAIALGASQYLLVGKTSNVEAWSLIKFNPQLSGTSYDPDSFSIVSAKLTLTTVYKIGDTTQYFAANVHRITSGWSAYTFTADSLSSLQYEGNIGFVVDSVSTTTFDLNASVVMDWFRWSIDTSLASKNLGIILEPASGCSKLVGYQAITTSSTTHPVLQVIVQKNNSAYNNYHDTLTYNSYSDVHVVKETKKTVADDKIVIQNGLPILGKLWFDISQIPAGVIINQVILSLTKDTVNSVHSSLFSDLLTAYFISDSSTNTVNSSYTASLASGTGVYSGDITNIVSEFYKEKKNIAIQIYPSTSIDGVDITTLYGSKYSDITKRPKLTIIYTKKGH